MMLKDAHLSQDHAFPDQWIKRESSQTLISQQQTNSHQQSFSLHLHRVQSHPLRQIFKTPDKRQTAKMMVIDFCVLKGFSL